MLKITAQKARNKKKVVVSDVPAPVIVSNPVVVPDVPVPDAPAPVPVPVPDAPIRLIEPILLKKKGVLTRIVEFHVEMFQDERGGISIKPVVAYVCMWFLCVGLILNSVADKSVRPSDTLINAVLMLGAMGLGADTADKFSLKTKSTDTPTTGTP